MQCTVKEILWVLVISALFLYGAVVLGYTDPCDSNPCKNDGICKIDGEKMNCLCFTPFYGEYCENDPCHPNPCRNLGTCEITARGFEGYDQGTYRCSCPESFSGLNCEIGNVKTTTQNFRTSTLMTTIWTTPYTSCIGNPCRNGGICEFRNNKETCYCPRSSWGEFCELSPCDPNPCKNDGICEIEDEKTKCCAWNLFGENIVRMKRKQLRRISERLP
ncbi:hypothetical protein TNIN_342071 [Trichonephila inaurata madagascariensis]|uniref:EGF-like domain-containing protein n=1 Tax=Trichonephila inaurata madagascariensis TaxID=2747483 RepID=A0A8X6Y3I2_9ARAC|nr:hypothetical protein TNIN_342071 [Trichonephila inaurata madagascariensis]